MPPAPQHSSLPTLTLTDGDLGSSVCLEVNGQLPDDVDINTALAAASTPGAEEQAIQFLDVDVVLEASTPDPEGQSGAAVGAPPHTNHSIPPQVNTDALGGAMPVGTEIATLSHHEQVSTAIDIASEERSCTPIKKHDLKGLLKYLGYDEAPFVGVLSAFLALMLTGQAPLRLHLPGCTNDAVKKAKGFKLAVPSAGRSCSASVWSLPEGFFFALQFKSTHKVQLNRAPEHWTSLVPKKSPFVNPKMTKFAVCNPCCLVFTTDANRKAFINTIDKLNEKQGKHSLTKLRVYHRAVDDKEEIKRTMQSETVIDWGQIRLMWIFSSHKDYYPLELLINQGGLEGNDHALITPVCFDAVVEFGNESALLNPEACVCHAASKQWMSNYKKRVCDVYEHNTGWIADKLCLTDRSDLFTDKADIKFANRVHNAINLLWCDFGVAGSAGELYARYQPPLYEFISSTPNSPPQKKMREAQKMLELTRSNLNFAQTRLDKTEHEIKQRMQASMDRLQQATKEHTDVRALEQVQQELEQNRIKMITLEKEKELAEEERNRAQEINETLKSQKRKCEEEYSDLNSILQEKEAQQHFLEDIVESMCKANTHQDAQVANVIAENPSLQRYKRHKNRSTRCT